MEEAYGLEREKLETFVRECGPAAIEKARHLTHDREEAKDLAQEAFRRLAQQWERCGPPRSIACMFTVILRNAFIDRLRSRKKWNVLPLDEDRENDGAMGLHELIAYREPDILDQLIRQETARKVRSDIKKLKLAHQEVLVLADMEAQSYQDIAALLNVSMGTVRSRLFRARESFRKQADCLAQ